MKTIKRINEGIEYVKNEICNIMYIADNEYDSM